MGRRVVNWKSRRNRDRSRRCEVCGARVWSSNYLKHRKRHAEKE